MKKFLRKREISIILILLVIASIAAAIVYVVHFQVLPQGGIDLLTSIPAPTASDRVLVFSPHPDDETIGAGGYIAQSTKAGAQVWVVLVTDGNKHGLTQVRYKEFANSLAVLGVTGQHEIFLNYPDGGMQNQNRNEVASRFSTIVNQIHPTVVIFPYEKDEHPDHAITGQIAYQVTASLGVKQYEYLVHNPRFPEPKSYAPDQYLLPPTDLITFNYDWEKDLLPSDIEQQKYNALQEYKSQLKTPILHGVLVGLVRKNELFAIPQKIGNL